MRRRYWIILGVLTAAVVAAGSAFAATKLESPSARSQAIINDAAGRLHVTPSALSGALQKALDDQVDAAVAAGRLTKAQGDALKAQIDSGKFPLVGGLGLGLGFAFKHGFGGPALGAPGFGFKQGFGGPGFGLLPEGAGIFAAGLHVVTAYLGITEAQLRAGLASGKSLAQIAQDHGKTADGLVAALVAAAKTRLDKAVTAGHLTSTQEQAILAKLQTLIQMLVNRTPPAGLQHMLHNGFGFGFRPQFGAPPSAAPPQL
jgi:hypothetical protein